MPNADYKYLSVSIIFTLGGSVDQFYWGGGGGGWVGRMRMVDR